MRVQAKLHSPPWTPFTFFGSGERGEEEEGKLLVKATGAEELKQKEIDLEEKISPDFQPWK